MLHHFKFTVTKPQNPKTPKPRPTGIYPRLYINKMSKITLWYKIIKLAIIVAIRISLRNICSGGVIGHIGKVCGSPSLLLELLGGTLINLSKAS